MKSKGSNKGHRAAYKSAQWIWFGSNKRCRLWVSLTVFQDDEGVGWGESYLSAGYICIFCTLMVMKRIICSKKNKKQGWKRVEFPVFHKIVSTGWVLSSIMVGILTQPTCGSSFSPQFGRLHYKAGAEFKFHIVFSKDIFLQFKNTFLLKKISSLEYNASSAGRD